MVDLLQVQVKHPGVALSKRESKLIESLVMRICVHHLYRRLARSFRIRPSRVDSIHLLVNHAIMVENGLSEEEAQVLIGDITKDIRSSLELCEVGSEPIVLAQRA